MPHPLSINDLGRTAKAFVINLDSRPDRLETFNKKFSRVDFDIERVAASTPATTVDWHSDPEVPDSALPTETACTVSHYRAYQKLIDENLEWALVIEDDAVPVLDFTRRLRLALDRWPEDAWYLQLGYVVSDPIGWRGHARAMAAYAFPRANESRMDFFRPGTHMSIVTIEFARYIVDRLRPATLAIDHRLYQLRHEDQLRHHAYVHFPCLARQDFSLSDIQPNPRWARSRAQRWNL